MTLVLILLVVAGLSWACNRGSQPPTSTATLQSTVVNASVRYSLPEGWQVAESTLTPNLGSPAEILSAGTFPLRSGGDNCAHMPELAMEDLGPEDALVSLQERSSPDESFTPRPSSFGPLLIGITPGDSYECMEEAERADVGTLLWHALRDEGRGFYLLVVIGSEATDKTRQETVDLLDSFLFDS